jgi:acyl carrier protein
MQKEEVINKINYFLIEEIEVEKNAIRPDALLKEDLGIDSLDFVDVAVIVEKTFGFKMKGEDLIEVKTLQDFYSFVSSKLNK